MSSHLELGDTAGDLTPRTEKETVSINEWKSSDDTYELTDLDRQVLETDVNQDRTAIEVQYDHNGEARFRARQFVGVIALPDGPVIEVSPKAAGENLVHLLRYSQNVSSNTVDQRIDLEAGKSFIDALAALFTSELENVLQRGLHKEYRSQESTRSHVRGRINLQRQLQRQGTTPTAFECRYNEQTRDTTANQAVLYAGSLLKRFVSDPDLRQKLDWQTNQLRQTVALRPVAPRELAQVEISRLNDYYANLLRYTDPVLRNIHIESFDAGIRDSYSMLVNMNTVFERAIERALEQVVADEDSLSFTPQAKTTNLIQGEENVRMYPDFIIESSTENSDTTVLVGDVKWKTGSVDNDDIYQMTAYILAHDAPGILVYPEQDGDVETEYTVDSEWNLSVSEIATSDGAGSFGEFIEHFEESVRKSLLSKHAAE